MDTTKDTSLAPITREELAMFYEASRISTQEAITKAFDAYNRIFADTIKTITDAIQTNGANYVSQISDLNTTITRAAAEIKDLEKSRIEKMETSINGVADKIDSAAAMARKQYYATTHPRKEKKDVSPLFLSSIYNKEQQLLWVDQTKGVISGACLKRGINKGNVYKYIYSAICEKYNLDDLLKEYKNYFNFPNATMMEMIAASDALRNAFVLNCERYLNNHIGNTTVVKKSNIKSAENLERINSAVISLSPTGKTPGRVYSKSYSIVDKANNFDIRQVAKSLIKKNHLGKRASIPTAISYDDELTEKFCTAIENYLKEKTNG